MITLTDSPSPKKSFKQLNNTKIEEEIKRVLTRINKLTTLFSELRSLIVGEYLKGEIRCIVIAVYVNEESIFHNSQKKGKGGWLLDPVTYSFEAKEYQTTMTKYCVNEYCFEFVYFFQMIDYMRLDNRLKDVKTVSILGTEVKALSSLDFVDHLLRDASNGSLDVHDSYWFNRSRVVEEGTYIFYLRDKLKPLEGESLETNSVTSKIQPIQNNYGFTDIDSLLISRGKLTEILLKKVSKVK